MRRIVVLVAVAFAAAGCGAAERRAAAPRHVDALAALVRPPGAHVEMDQDDANLASAVVTYAFGQLPEYIDGGAYRLLPHDLFRELQPGATIRKTYHLVVPHTNVVLDTVVTSGLTESEARATAKLYGVAVTFDGRALPDPERHWVFYRNNGAQICRIYFPGDLGALNMGANSVVFRPLPPGRHLLRVVVRQRSGRGMPARVVTDYRLRVLARAPNARERAIAPDERTGEQQAVNRTPLTFRQPQK